MNTIIEKEIQLYQEKNLEMAKQGFGELGREQEAYDEMENFLRQSLKRVVEEAHRNTPVGFVRQWINEDLLKEGHRLVTDEDIQSFINVALTPNNHE